MNRAIFSKSLLSASVGVWLPPVGWSQETGKPVEPAVVAGAVEVVISAEAGVSEPFSVVFDSQGTMFGVEFTKGNRVFKRTADGKISFLAGVKGVTNEKTALAEVADGPAEQARFNGLHDLCLTHSTVGLALRKAPEDVLLLADTFNQRIRRLDLKSGQVTTVVGTGKAGKGGSGRAVDAELNVPICISPGVRHGQFWITDLGNQRVRMYDQLSGNIQDVVGNGQRGKVQEGAAATQTPLIGPRATTGDGKVIWVALREGNSLLQVLDGKVKTILNAGGKPGYSEGPTPLDVQLNGPKYLSMDTRGNVIICDTENHVVRRYLPAENKVELLVGMPGKAGTTVGPSGPETQLKRPHGARVEKDWLYVADSENNRVLRVPYR